MMSKTAYEVVMPKLGLIMTEAQLLEWHKQEQEWVEQGETLFSLESEKSVIEIEAPASGYVKILVPEGDTVPVMTPVALIDSEGAGATEIPKDKPASKQKTTPKPAVVAQSPNEIQTFKGLRATPKARYLARQRGLSLTGLDGSGPRGMIVSSDLETAKKQTTAVNATPVARKMAQDCGLDLAQVAGTGPGGPITRNDVSDAIAKLVQSKTAVSPPASHGIALTGLRGVIAERLSASWNERPQVSLMTEVDATRIIAARQSLKENGRKVSYNAFLVLASAKALKEQPHLNVCLTESGLVQYETINIGVAVDTERGLMVPVLHETDQKSLQEIDAQLIDLFERTLESRLLPDEYTGGSFTITNLGAFGVDTFTPIINPPEVAILGVGRIKPKPVAIGGGLVVREMVTLSLSFDHRLIDGAPAARFLQRIAELIENPEDLE